MVGKAITIPLKQASQRFLKKITKTSKRLGTEDRISMLPDDLLVNILLLIPTKEAVATMILSKRWRFLWTLMPKLVYPLKTNTQKVGFVRLLGCLFEKRDKQVMFIDKSLQNHKAEVLDTLYIKHPVDVDMLKWIEPAVEPTGLPKSLYTCDTIVCLQLFDKILVDIPCSACLPSLVGLGLYRVVYKDEDSLVKLLSSCPILMSLIVVRYHQDNVKTFKIKVPSLEWLSYKNAKYEPNGNGAFGSLVIDSPALKTMFITDFSNDSCSIENKPRLNKASIDILHFLDKKFERSLSTLVYLEIFLDIATSPWFIDIDFTWLKECHIILEQELDWIEPVMLLLQRTPNLKVLRIDKTYTQVKEKLALSWNLPSSVPQCLSNHLEIFEWKGYGGRMKEEEVVRYIFSNSMCLKRAGISIKSSFRHKHRNKIMKKLESIPKVSTSSQLLFSPKFDYKSFYDL